MVEKIKDHGKAEGKAGCAKCICGVIVALTIVGIMAMVGGGVLYVLFPGFFNQKIQEKMVLSKDSPESLERFVNPPAATMSFYFFNVTNMDDVNSGLAHKPILQEVGPFVFQQNKTKEILEWNKEEGTVTFQYRTEYIFLEDESAESLSTLINHPNLADVALAEVLTPSYTGFRILNIPPEELGIIGPLIVTHSVGEVLFGYKIPYLEWFQTKSPFSHYLLNKAKKIPPRNEFGLLHEKNNSLSKEFQVYTGQTGMEKFMSIATFDDMAKLPYWVKDSHCNDINGTDGSQFPPGIKPSDILYVFSNDVCRSLLLTFEKKVEIQGIEAYRFSVPERAFQAPTVNDENQCYCIIDSPACTKAGVLPLGPCQGNKPVAMSAPHFYFSDQSFVDAFDGDLIPNKTKHQTFIDIEPNTGAVIRGRKRLQVNVVTTPDKEYRTLRHSNYGYFPFVWAEEGGEIDEDKAALLKSMVLNPKRAVEWSLISLMSIGAILVITALTLYIRKRN